MMLRCAVMKMVQAIAFSVAMSLVACGYDEPSKTAYQASSPARYPPSTPQANAAVNEATGTATSGGGPTSAEVPHEGASPGNRVATEKGAEEAQGGTILTDEQVLQFAHTANVGEIDQARLALSKSKDTRVRDLAQMMIRDHTQSDNKGAVVAKKDNLTRAPSRANDSLRSDAEGATRTLRTEPDAEFDKNYVDTQIREHQALLDSLDQKLIANVKSADVKAYLIEVRAAAASHLQHAQDLRTDLTN
jgi:putative membrane protein